MQVSRLVRYGLEFIQSIKGGKQLPKHRWCRCVANVALVTQRVLNPFIGRVTDELT